MGGGSVCVGAEVFYGLGFVVCIHFLVCVCVGLVFRLWVCRVFLVRLFFRFLVRGGAFFSQIFLVRVALNSGVRVVLVG